MYQLFIYLCLHCGPEGEVLCLSLFFTFSLMSSVVLSIEEVLMLMFTRGLSKTNKQKMVKEYYSLGKYLVVLTKVEYTLGPSNFTPRKISTECKHMFIKFHIQSVHGSTIHNSKK